MDLRTHFPSFEGNPKSKRDVQKFIINTFTEKASAPGSNLVSPDSLQEEEEDEILLQSVFSYLIAIETGFLKLLEQLK